MPKKQQKKQAENKKGAVAAPQVAPKPQLSPAEEVINSFSNPLIQIFCIIVISFIFYGNSIKNDYALDDIMFVTHNQFVQKGTDGIPDLFTKESMYGFIGSASPISGGRWRPLSLITFAIEKQYFGSSPNISHFINVLLVILIGIIMLLLLTRFVFPSMPIAALITTLLFIAHPVHTEAIANIKSRDELLSWLFLLLTMYCSLNFLTKKSYWQLIFSFVCYFLALISKENGITFIAILPVTFYFFTKEKLVKIVLTTLPFMAIAIVYVLMRVHYVPFKPNTTKEIMNAPFLLATTQQHWATAIMMMGKYLLLLIWPNPLSCDYSYNQVPYVNFNDWRVIVSLIIQAALIIYALYKLAVYLFTGSKERNLLVYCILFYFASIIIYSNFYIDIGTFIGERFLYQPSFAFCIAVVFIGDRILRTVDIKQLSQKITFVVLPLSAIFILSAFQTIKRNSEWKNDKTLWTADVVKVPNSARAQNGCGMAQILMTNTEKDSLKKDTLLYESIAHLKRAHAIQPTYIDPWLNMGVAYSRLNDYDSAEYCWDQARKIDANHPMLVVEYDPDLAIDFMNAGLKAGAQKDYAKSIGYFYRALKHNKKNADVWYNLGGAYYTTAQYDSARIAWEQCLKLKPNYPGAKQGMRALPKNTNQPTGQ